MRKLQAVDCRSHEQAARMPDGRDRARHVDEVHDGSTQDVPERIGIIREDRLDHAGRAFRAALRVGQFRQFLVKNAFSLQRSSDGRSSSRIEWRSETVDS